MSETATRLPPRRLLIDLDDMSADEISTILQTADSMKEVLGREIKQVPALRGITVCNMFYEDSTRTRISFELAARALSASVVNFSARGSSVEKGESLADTVRTLQALGTQVVVVRHREAGVPYLLAEHFNGAIINAGDGWHAHPTQALLDMFTIREQRESLQGCRVLIVGDMLHSRVVRSNLWGLTTMGADVTLCGPPTLLGPAHYWTRTWQRVRVSYTLDDVLPDADVVMVLRLQRERQQAGLLPSLRDYSRAYGLSAARMARARPDVLVLHPGPINEGLEIDPVVARSTQSLIEQQVTNGVAVRMALLYHMATHATAAAS